MPQILDRVLTAARQLGADGNDEFEIESFEK